MKLVIEIDKDKNDRLDYLDVIALKEIIRNGKPFSSVIDEIKAEINYVGAHSDYGMQCVFAVAVAIIDKHRERIMQNECKTDKETFEITGK